MKLPFQHLALELLLVSASASLAQTPTPTPAPAPTLRPALSTTVVQKPDGSLGSQYPINLADPKFSGILPIARLPVGAATGTVAAGNDSRLSPLPALVPVTGSLDPSTLTFKQVSSTRDVCPIDGGFLVWNDDFSSLSTSGYTQSFTGTTNVDARIGNTGLAITNDGATNQEMLAAVSPFKIPYFGVAVSVASFSGSTPYDQAAVGMKATNGDYIVATYDAGTGRGYFVTKVGATTTNLIAGTTTLTYSAPLDLSLVIADRAATLWVRQSGGVWRVLARMNTTDYGIDFRLPATLAAYRPYWRTYGTNGTRTTFSNLRAGYAGRVGYLAPKCVTFEDGTPMIVNGKAIMISGMPCSAGSSDRAHTVPACYTEICSLDLKTFSWQHLAKLAFRRPGGSGTDNSGLIMGDNAGNMVWDRNNNTFKVVIGSWGDDGGTTPVHMYLYQSRDNLLAGVHVLTAVQQLNLPNPNSAPRSEYDATIMQPGGVGTMWYAAYSLLPGSPYPSAVYSQPALASAASLTGAFSLIGRGTGTSNYVEGASFFKMAGLPYFGWIVSGGGGGFASDQVFDLAFNYKGTINIPTSTSAHPTILAYSEAGLTRYLLVTFDAAPFMGLDYSWGNALTWLTDQTVTGDEWPVLAPPFGLR